MPINRTSHPQGRRIQNWPTQKLARIAIEKREREKGD